jgi:hypothetical protein
MTVSEQMVRRQNFQPTRLIAFSSRKSKESKWLYKFIMKTNINRLLSEQRSTGDPAK